MLDLQLGLDLGSYAAKRRPTPIDLFQSGEEGVWYEPADESTLFQDSAGTTPVTADGDPVGLMLDKSKGLVLGPELNGDVGFDNPSYWDNNTGSTNVSGGEAIWSAAASGNRIASTSLSVSSGLWYVLSFKITSISQGSLRFADSVGNALSPDFNTTGVKTAYFRSTGANETWIRAVGTTTATVTSLSVRELPGNHATQTVSSARPTYQRGDARGVVNLLKWSEDFNDVSWVKAAATTVTPNATIAPDGSLTADKIIPPNNTGLDRDVRKTITQPSGSTFSVYLKAAERNYAMLVVLGRNPTAGEIKATIDLTTGATNTITGTGTVTTTLLPDGWILASIEKPEVVGSADIEVRVAMAESLTDLSVVGDGVSGIYAWGAQLESGSTATPYQRNDSHLGGVATGLSTDLRWLSFDGVDDYLVTGNIDFTGTDKMGVFAGVRKLSDSTSAVLFEFGADSGNVNGTFGGFAPGISGTNQFDARARGTISRIAAVTSSYPAPVLVVYGALFDISAPITQLRLDGLLAADETGSLGTGSFGNYPLYVGRRGGIALPFNGNIYGLVTRGALSDASDITSAETYLAKRTGVVL